MAKKKMAELAEVGIEPNALPEGYKINFVKIKAFDRPQDNPEYDPFNPDHFPEFPGLKKLGLNDVIPSGAWLIQRDTLAPTAGRNRLTYQMRGSLSDLRAGGDYKDYWVYKEGRRRPYPKPLPLP